MPQTNHFPLSQERHILLYKLIHASIKAVTGFIDEENNDITLLNQQIENSYQRKFLKHKQHIENVEDFILKQTTKIEITDSSKLETVGLAINKKAPFIGDKKNSVADAVILLSSIEYIKSLEKTITPFDDTDLFEPFKIYPDSYFVSSNGGDFSSKTEKEIIHPDLEPILERTNTKFFYTLGKLINFLEAEFLTQEEEEALEMQDLGRFCEVCEYEHFGTVHTDGHHTLFDPKSDRYDPNQLKIEFDEYEYPVDTENEPYSILKTAHCEMCNAKFIECNCGELIHIEEKSYAVECENGCGTKYKIHADVDKKGVIHSLDYEIIEEYTCVTCGSEFSSVDELGNCEECAAYEEKYLFD